MLRIHRDITPIGCRAVRLPDLSTTIEFGRINMQIQNAALHIQCDQVSILDQTQRFSDMGFGGDMQNTRAIAGSRVVSD